MLLKQKSAVITPHVLWVLLTVALIGVGVTRLQAQQTPAGLEEGPEASPLQIEFDTRFHEIAEHDARAYYRLGVDFYRRYDKKKNNIEALELARVALHEAAGIYRITPPDGEAFFYNVQSKDRTPWERIVQLFHKHVVDAYELVLAEIEEETGTMPQRQTLQTLRETERRAILNQLDGEHVAHVARVHPDAVIMRRIVSEKFEAGYNRKHPDGWQMFFYVIGGLAIFLLGMKYMSEGMQAVAGARLRKMINAVTDNRLMAVGVGTGVTCLVQSSSITTVIVVGLVNSGLMALHQSIGVIMGANIGTTITGWILVLKIGKYGLPIIGLAVFPFLFSKGDRLRYLAMAAMGFGMVFFGLEMMKDGFQPMNDLDGFKAAFLWFDANNYIGVLKCAAVGCLLTFIVQSSSATLGITIGLASTGAIPFETAAALVLGENIGTTITAFLASLGTTTNAKRAAYAHVMFNVVGVMWITALFTPYAHVIGEIVNWAKGSNPATIDYNTFEDTARYATIMTAGIAMVHTGFNVINTLAFLPFVRKFSHFMEWLIPDKALKESPHLETLDIRMVESPVMGLERSRGEIIKMGRGIEKMLGWTKTLLNQPKPDEDLVEKVFHRENIMDNVQQEVIQFMTELLTSSAPYSVANEGRQQLRVADEFESISDYISGILKAHLRLVHDQKKLTDDEFVAIMNLHAMVEEYLHMVVQAFINHQPDILSRAKTQGQTITARCKELRDDHLQFLTDNRGDPILSMSYTQMINGYRKVKDHALNVAEAIAE